MNIDGTHNYVATDVPFHHDVSRCSRVQAGSRKSAFGPAVAVTSVSLGTRPVHRPRPGGWDLWTESLRLREMGRSDPRRRIPMTRVGRPGVTSGGRHTGAHSKLSRRTREGYLYERRAPTRGRSRRRGRVREDDQGSEGTRTDNESSPESET